MPPAKRATTTPPDAPTHIALLRGINVGGKHTLPMAVLSAIFADAGCRGVRTYIQSGNIAFAATPSVAKRLPHDVSERILEQFGFQPRITLRTAVEIANVAAANPFLSDDADPATLHVGFLDDAPPDRLIAALDPQRSPGDRFAVRGREIFLHTPNGMARTKLTNAYFDSALATMSTFRNWRTVLKLAEMMRPARA